MKENSREKTINLNNEEEIALNNRIIDLETKIEKKDKIIDKMAEYIYNMQIECNVYYKDKKQVKQYFENKAKEEQNG